MEMLENDIRQKFYTTRDLLQGVQTNTVQENETLFENVQELIIKTGRFNR